MEQDVNKAKEQNAEISGYQSFLMDLSFFMEEPLVNGNCISDRVELEAKKISEILANLSPKTAEILLDKELKAIFSDKYQTYVQEFKLHLLKHVNREKYLSFEKATSTATHYDLSKILAFSFLGIIVIAILGIICFVTLKKEEPDPFEVDNHIDKTQSKNDSIFDKTGRIEAMTFEEPLNGGIVVFDNTFLTEIKKALKDEVEQSFRQNTSNGLKRFNIKPTISLNSQIKGLYVTKKNKKYIYSIYEATASVKLPSLNRTDSTSITSVFIISVQNDKLVTTQCAINEKDKLIVLKEPCKKEVLAKQGIAFSNKELLRLNK
jgi:hypothetical protein